MAPFYWSWRRFDRVVALDNAPAMLEQAAKGQSYRAYNVEFISAIPQQRDRKDSQADCAVINMVLHHTPDPGRSLARSWPLPGARRCAAGHRALRARPGLGAGELR